MVGICTAEYWRSSRSAPAESGQSGRDAPSSAHYLNEYSASYVGRLQHRLTFDLHETLAKRLKMDIFFCDPHSPWQRAANADANGLIREYLSKGTDRSTVTNARLRAIETRLNRRPRQMLRFQAPDEVFSRLKLNESILVALQA
jgi:IS30 family transposase